MALPTNIFRKLFGRRPAPTGAGDDLSFLLSREAQKIDQRAARRLFQGRSVLVTGAGGTIGAELSRQIAAFGPSRLTLLENSEYALYKILLELGEAGFESIISSSLTDICREPHLRRVFERDKPDIVVHAAAFKHVPIVEGNRCAGALTNCYGAKLVIDMAMEHGVESVVVISSDKAVNPTSFMGATKRITELYAQAHDVAQSETRFVTVRFGNVLASSGSVVPLFRRQIEYGGPVTVTHPEIKRYFMTTREAVQLVLQAASLDNAENPIVTHDGRVFVLDMGDAVKILDLAKRMIESYGLKPGEDIEINFSGLRPGEKLFEEVFLDTDKLVKTGADGVLLASPAMIDLPLLKPRLEDVIRSAIAADQAALDEAVHHLVPEFRAMKASETHAGSRSDQ